LLLSGVLATAAYIPLLGYLFRKTITVVNPRMPSLKATWSCTYDAYGAHAFQHYIPQEEFISYFVRDNVEARLSPDGGVLFAKTETPSSNAI
jgi:hypothetical protein